MHTDLKENTWYRSDSGLLYCVTPNTSGTHAMREAAPMVNRLTVQVQANNTTPRAEADALADELFAYLNRRTTTPPVPVATGEAWVAVADRLPELIGGYLCLCDDGNQMVCLVNVLGDWTAYPGGRYYGDLAGGGIPQPDRMITHWMPLPQAPTTPC